MKSKQNSKNCKRVEKCFRYLHFRKRHKLSNCNRISIKIKRITYIHAEGIPGGELKHGPLALMDTDVFVIIINPNDSTYTDTLTSAREIKARGAKIIGVSDIESNVYDYWIEIPKLAKFYIQFQNLFQYNY